MCKFIQIEHIDCVNNLAEIIKNDNVDGYIFGPNDLSGSINLLGRPFDKKVTEIMKDAISELRCNGKYIGIASGGYKKEVLEHWSSFDIDILVVGADFDFIRDLAIENRKTMEIIHKK